MGVGLRWGIYPPNPLEKIGSCLKALAETNLPHQVWTVTWGLARPTSGLSEQGKGGYGALQNIVGHWSGGEGGTSIDHTIRLILALKRLLARIFPQLLPHRQRLSNLDSGLSLFESSTPRATSTEPRSALAGAQVKTGQCTGRSKPRLPVQHCLWASRAFRGDGKWLAGGPFDERLIAPAIIVPLGLIVKGRLETSTWNTGTSLPTPGIPAAPVNS